MMPQTSIRPLPPAPVSTPGHGVARRPEVVDGVPANAILYNGQPILYNGQPILYTA